MGGTAPLVNHKSKSRSVSLDKGHSQLGSMSGPGGPQSSMNGVGGPGVNAGIFQQNMSSNGEFTVNETFGMNQPFHQNYRSLSISSTPSNLEYPHQHQRQQSNPRNFSLPSNLYNSNMAGPNSHIPGPEPTNNGMQMMAHMNNKVPNFNSNDYTINEYPFGFPGQAGLSQRNVTTNGPTHQYSFSNGSQMDGSNQLLQHPAQHHHHVSISGSNSTSDMYANGNGTGSSILMGHKHQSSVSSVQLNHPQPLGHYTTSGGNNGGINHQFTPPPGSYHQPNYYSHYQQQQQVQPQAQFKSNVFPGQHHLPQQFQQAPALQHLQNPGQAGNNFVRGHGVNHGHNLSISSTSSLPNGGVGSEGLMFNGNPLAFNYYQ
ncbi:uncharacterized protein CANTADRAFT_26451 [Suhomyces tanzawaensis NRRL Y-17324]|uniref:Uncharacterized protein n=1 Tax=Suhomyces tanzawaensis NRRL Y-17324 TaxID=984487 RepID=A0A1E4SFJ5_9ASCO|nr:uncharacterized protein CANTADRAFT_26451 [Suhomyces tanzawaensis NRRL Y-17324]ODV78284.1 hypothetical protein CANTADRAFT_26451 [Suhomyces tanzawaensis NRRL Y-17324]